MGSNFVTVASFFTISKTNHAKSTTCKNVFYKNFAPLEVVCVASVSVRLSARSRHFSLLWPREIGASAKKCFHQCCARPNFCAAKKRKSPRTESPTETLATQATLEETNNSVGLWRAIRRQTETNTSDTVQGGSNFLVTFQMRAIQQYFLLALLVFVI